VEGNSAARQVTQGRSALVSAGAATKLLAYDGHPSRIYVRTDPNRVQEVANLLAATANPFQVNASLPSDTLTAQVAVKQSAGALFLGLRAIALLVGAIGITNVIGGHVRLDGLLAEGQVPGDLPVGTAPGQPCQNLPFPPGQDRQRIGGVPTRNAVGHAPGLGRRFGFVRGIW
jgi:hypothetical protein